MARRLSEADTIKLIQLYRQHDCLWDINLPSYRNRFKRAEALEKISTDLNIEGMNSSMDIKMKMKSIRGTYYLELDKIEKAKNEGHVYVPRLKWFEEFHAFIKNVTVKRRNTNNHQVQEDVVYLEEVEHEDENTSENETKTVFEDEITIDPISTPHETKLVPKPKRKRFIGAAKHRPIDNGVRQRFVKAPVGIRGGQWILAREEHDLDIFGRHVAGLLKKLSEEQVVIAQEQIQSILTQCRLADIRARNNTTELVYE